MPVCHTRPNVSTVTVTVTVTRLLKSNFFAQPLFLFECFAQTKWAKNQQKKVKNYPKEVKTVVYFAFLRSKTQILSNLWNFLRDRTVAQSNFLDTLTLTPTLLCLTVTSKTWGASIRMTLLPLVICGPCVTDSWDGAGLDTLLCTL